MEDDNEGEEEGGRQDDEEEDEMLFDKDSVSIDCATIIPFSFLTILKVLEAWKKVCPTCRRELDGEPNGDEEDDEEEVW